MARAPPLASLNAQQARWITPPGPSPDPDQDREAEKVDGRGAFPPRLRPQRPPGELLTERPQEIGNRVSIAR